jgi:hypothetical protein
MDKMPKIPITPGSPVENESFFGREKELQLAWKRLQNNKTLLLSAPRRVYRLYTSFKVIYFSFLF